jgi:glycosyltransferase
MKISVVTATRNSAETIVDTLESVNAQDYSCVEHIIVDGCSTDATLKLVSEFGKRVVNVVSEKDKGIYDALNKGISLATGDVVGFLHSDDFYAADTTLSSIAREFVETSVDAVYGDLHYVAQTDVKKTVREWVSGDFNKEKFKWGWMPPHPTFHMKREHYVALRGFDLQFSIAADYEAMLRYLWTNDLDVTYIPQVLIKMRTGGVSNRSLVNIVQKSAEDRLAMRKNGIPTVRGLLFKNLSKIPQFF